MTFRKPLATQAFSFAGMHCTNKKRQKHTFASLRGRSTLLLRAFMREIVTNSFANLSRPAILAFVELSKWFSSLLNCILTTCARPNCLDSLIRCHVIVLAWWRPCAKMSSDQTVPRLYQFSLRSTGSSCVKKRSSTTRHAFQDGQPSRIPGWAYSLANWKSPKHTMQDICQAACTCPVRRRHLEDLRQLGKNFLDGGSSHCDRQMWCNHSSMTDDGCIYYILAWCSSQIHRSSSLIHWRLTSWSVYSLHIRHDVDLSAVFLVNVGSHVRFPTVSPRCRRSLFGDDVEANYAASWGQLQRAQLDHNMWTYMKLLSM